MEVIHFDVNEMLRKTPLGYILFEDQCCKTFPLCELEFSDDAICRVS